MSRSRFKASVDKIGSATFSWGQWLRMVVFSLGYTAYLMGLSGTANSADAANPVSYTAGTASTDITDKPIDFISFRDTSFFVQLAAMFDRFDISGERPDRETAGRTTRLPDRFDIPEEDDDGDSGTATARTRPLNTAEIPRIEDPTDDSAGTASEGLMPRNNRTLDTDRIVAVKAAYIDRRSTSDDPDKQPQASKSKKPVKKKATKKPVEKDKVAPVDDKDSGKKTAEKAKKPAKKNVDKDSVITAAVADDDTGAKPVQKKKTAEKAKKPVKKTADKDNKDKATASEDKDAKPVQKKKTAEKAKKSVKKTAEKDDAKTVDDTDTAPQVKTTAPQKDQDPDGPVEAPVVKVADSQNSSVEPDNAQDTPAQGQGDAPAASGQVAVLDTDATGRIEVEATAGRVTTIALEGEGIASVRVVDSVDYGNLTVNPDNSLALVLTGEAKTKDTSFAVEVTYDDGRTEVIEAKVDVQAGTQDSGWGAGDHYMLATDANGDIIVEHGENHRKVYVSGDNDALTLEDIALIEGIPVKQVNKSFFLKNPEYGATEEMALAEDAASMAWKALTGTGTAPSSNWLLFERGHEYNDMGRLIESGTRGESALNPIYIGAYGTGDDPLITSEIKLIKKGAENVVIQGLDFDGGLHLLSGANILMDDVTITDEEMNVQNIDGFTLRNSEIIDVTEDEAVNGRTWQGHADRTSGIFVKKTEGLLIEDTFFDHNGWEEGYDVKNGSAKKGQAPSQYSHNVYIQSDNRDVTFRDNVVMQGAGDGAQVRSGGFVEDNVFIDNNNGLMVGAGGMNKDGTGRGNYSLVNNNVVTSGAHKESAHSQGGLTQGLTNNGIDTSLTNNVVTHLADPDNAREQKEKQIGHYAIRHKNDDPFYNDTVVHNWVGGKNYTTQDARNENTEGLDYAVLNDTTIQNYTADLLNTNTATIDDLSDHLRAQADGTTKGEEVDADHIIDYFQDGFDTAPETQQGGNNVRFVPNDLGGGVRWDNRLNWTGEELPDARDNVDLGGNWVSYSGTHAIRGLAFGDGGALSASQGRLTITGEISVEDTGATLTIDGAGQVWMAGYRDTDRLTIDAEGGRLVNTGKFDGTVDITASDDAQVILATDGGAFELSDGSSLTIVGDDARVGVDSAPNGKSAMILRDDSDLHFVADKTGMGALTEFFSGVYDSDLEATKSIIDLGDANLHLDVSAIAGGKPKAYDLIQFDEIVGTFDSLKVTGLGKKQDLTVMVDYDLDTVLLSLGQDGQGKGRVTLDTRGDESSAQAETSLWNTLTAAEEGFL